MSVVSVRKKFDTTKLKEGVCRVGFFSASKYESTLPVAQVAWWNEFGVPNRIPARPFMRPVMHQNRAKIISNLRSRYQKALKDNENTLKVLHQTGEEVKGMIETQISNTWEPPNAPSTQKKKGKNAPLRDTLVMLHSVRYQAEEYKK